MFPIETCRRCAECETVTPHRRERVRPLPCAVAVALALACALGSGSDPAAGAIVAMGALVLLALRLSRPRSPDCERCKSRLALALREEKRRTIAWFHV